RCDHQAQPHRLGRDRGAGQDRARPDVAGRCGCGIRALRRLRRDRAPAGILRTVSADLTIGAPARELSRAGAPRPTRRPAAGRMRRRDALTGYLFIAPQLLGIVLFVVVPLLLVVYYAFQEWNVLSGEIHFV